MNSKRKKGSARILAVTLSMILAIRMIAVAGMSKADAEEITGSVSKTIEFEALGDGVLTVKTENKVYEIEDGSKEISVDVGTTIETTALADTNTEITSYQISGEDFTENVEVTDLNSFSYNITAQADINTVSVTFEEPATEDEAEEIDYGSGEGTCTIACGEGGKAAFTDGSTSCNGKAGDEAVLNVTADEGYEIESIAIYDDEDAIETARNLDSDDKTEYKFHLLGGKNLVAKIAFSKIEVDNFAGAAGAVKIKSFWPVNSTKINEATIYKTDDNTIAYCIDTKKHGPGKAGRWYKPDKSNSMQSTWDYLLANGYPRVKKIMGTNFTARDAHDVTQLAAWMVVDSSYEKSTSSYEKVSKKVRTAALKLAAAAKAYKGGNKAIDGTALIYYPSGNKKQSMIVPRSAGKLTLKKVSGNNVISDNNSCYTLAGAVYGVYTSISDAKNDKDKQASLITTSSGSSNTVTLAAGTYYVKETKASKGYKLDDKVYEVKLTTGTDKVITSTELPQNASISALLIKKDAETGKNIPQGSASLKGAVYEVSYYDIADASADDLKSETPLRTWKFTTDDDGTVVLSEEYKTSGDKLFTSSDGKTAVMPIGTITLQEKQAPEGYLLNDQLYVANISYSDDSKSETIETYNFKLNSDKPNDRVKRGDFIFVKIEDGTSKRLAGIPFRITSDTTGESHILVTDENGMIDTSSAFNSHESNTNGNDEAVNDSGEVDETKLSDEFGVYFNGYNSEEGASANDSYGALPYDSYTLDELRCSANEGLILAENIKLKVSKDGYNIDAGTITDDQQTVLFPSIGTTASLSDENTITDIVEYKDLIPGEEYVMLGQLMDKETGEELKGYTAESVFTASNSGSGTVEVNFDVSDLAGTDIVVFEECMLNEETVAYHKDINSKDQTVSIPAENTSKPVQNTPKTTSVKTGDSSMIGVAAVFVLLSAIGTFIAAYKRKREK